MLEAVAVAQRGGGWAESGLPGATGVRFHSARVRPGDAFFALPGAAQHGLEHAAAALAAGAAYVVSDRPHPQGVTVPDPAGLLLALGRDARSRFQGVVIGVTGSAGKTTCKALLGAALAARTTPGNRNTPLALAEFLVDTELAGVAGGADASSVGAGARLVLELGIDHPGEMDALLALAKPTHAVVTLIAPSHLEALGSVAGVAREKLKLVDAAGYAFVSARAAGFLNAAQRQKTTTYGLNNDFGDGAGSADVTGDLSEITPSGQTLSALGTSVRLPFVGAALAEGALAAIAVAAHLGDDLGAAAKQLSGARLEPGRLHVQPLGALTLIDDSYNSSPAAAAAALETLAHFPRPHSAVLSDMLELGADSARYHEDLGKLTLSLERVIAIGPEMRALKQANPNAHHLETFDLSALAPLLPERGTLLVKGSRGGRLERLVSYLNTRLGPVDA